MGGVAGGGIRARKEMSSAQHDQGCPGAQQRIEPPRHSPCLRHTAQPSVSKKRATELHGASVANTTDGQLYAELHFCCWPDP